MHDRMIAKPLYDLYLTENIASEVEKYYGIIIIDERKMKYSTHSLIRTRKGLSFLFELSERKKLNKNVRFDPISHQNSNVSKFERFRNQTHKKQTVMSYTDLLLTFPQFW